MNRIFYITIIFLLSIINLNYDFSQKPWTLEKCITYALEHNIKIDKQRISSKIAGNNYRQAKAEKLPDLSISGNHSIDHISDNIQSGSFSANSSVTLFNGRKIHFKRQKENYDFRAQLQNVERLKHIISLNITSAYLNILLQKALKKKAQNQIKITNAQLQRIKGLIKAGELSKDKLTEMKAQKAKEKYKITLVRNRLRTAKIHLIQLLDIDTIGTFSIKTPSIEITTQDHIKSPVQKIYQKALNLPRIQMKKYQIQSAKKQLNLSKSRLYPSVSLNFGYGTNYSNEAQEVVNTSITQTIVGHINKDQSKPVYKKNVQKKFKDKPVIEQFEDNAAGNIALTFTIPIFNKFYTQYNINNSKLHVKYKKYELEHTKNQLYEDIQKAYNDARAANKNYIAAKKQVKYMKQAYQIAEEKFQVGMINTIEYKRTKNDLSHAQNELARKKYQYIFKVKILDFYKGHKLTF